MFNNVWYNLCFSICVFPYSVDYKRNFDWQRKHSSILLSFGSIPVNPRPDLDFQDICIFSVNKSWSHICSIYKATSIIATLSVSFCSMLLTAAKLAASLELVSDCVYSESVTLVDLFFLYHLFYVRLLWFILHCFRFVLTIFMPWDRYECKMSKIRCLWSHN